MMSSVIIGNPHNLQYNTLIPFSVALPSLLTFSPDQFPGVCQSLYKLPVPVAKLLTMKRCRTGKTFILSTHKIILLWLRISMPLWRLLIGLNWFKWVHRGPNWSKWPNIGPNRLKLFQKGLNRSTKIKYGLIRPSITVQNKKTHSVESKF